MKRVPFLFKYFKLVFGKNNRRGVFMIASGKAIVDKKTKRLLQRIRPGQIAVVWHKDIDPLAAERIIKQRVRAVINFEKSLSGTFHNEGPKMLLDAGIPLLDVVESYGEIIEGDEIRINDEGHVYAKEILVAKATVLDPAIIIAGMSKSKRQHAQELEKFVENTLRYIKRECNIVSDQITLPNLTTKMEGKHVLIVIRGRDHKNDLLTLTSYIHEVKPVLIGVDGGADTLMELGYVPDIIIGDMDSISDEGLMSGAEIVVHAYKDGKAPGLERIKSLGLPYKVFSMLGTSEDAALLLAYESGADLLVAVGTHTNMIDFLEKGRWGMASTFLVRLKVGHILIDAKGVNKLYKSNMKLSYVAAMCFAAGFPLSMICMTSPAFRHLIRLLSIRVKLIIGLL